MRALLCAAMLVSTVANAQSLDIKNTRLGMTEAEVRSLFPSIRCDTRKGPFGDRSCIDTSTTFGGAKATFFVSFADNAAVSISVHLNPKEFDSVTAAITAKFGNPVEQSEPTVVTRAGVSYNNTTIEWRSGDERLTARRYAGSIDTSSIGLMSNKALELFKERKKEENASRAKDL